MDKCKKKKKKKPKRKSGWNFFQNFKSTKFRNFLFLELKKTAFCFYACGNPFWHWFNRFFTNSIGTLDHSFWKTSFKCWIDGILNLIILWSINDHKFSIGLWSRTPGKNINMFFNKPLLNWAICVYRCTVLLENLILTIVEKTFDW